MKISQTIILCLALISSSIVLAQELVLSSKNKQPVFIELFTSQGCSSCPPAEEYINRFTENSQLWEKYIPIVFHVDYWDYIGWKDVFAQPEFSARQYRYAKLKRVRTVYTPGFVVNGSTWRRGFFNALPQAKGLDQGVLRVKVVGKKAEVIFKPEKRLTRNLKLNVAVLGIDMLVNIAAGENEGREARHSFVVLGYNSQISDNNEWEMQLPKLKQHVSATRYALVAWISKIDDPAPLQAVAGWFALAN